MQVIVRRILGSFRFPQYKPIPKVVTVEVPDEKAVVHSTKVALRKLQKLARPTKLASLVPKIKSIKRR